MSEAVRGIVYVIGCIGIGVATAAAIVGLALTVDVWRMARAERDWQEHENDG